MNTVAHHRRTFDWFPWMIGGLTTGVMVLFLIYPIGKTVLFSFVPQGKELGFANLSLVNFENFLL